MPGVLRRISLFGLQMGVGIILLLLFIFLNYPFGPKDLYYVKFLLILASMILVPMGFFLLKQSLAIRLFALKASVSFALAYFLPKSLTAAILILPWIIFALLHCYHVGHSFLEKGNRRITDYLHMAAAIYLTIGGFWAMIDRLGWEPMGFSPTIVLLTAIHFHYAGFLLPLLGSLYLSEKHNSFGKLVSWGLILGVPLVAIGITSSQFQWPGIIELASGSFMALSGFLMGTLYVRKGFSFLPKWVGLLWTIGGLSLCGGMVLAFLYACRSIIHLPFLSIPWMYAFHGSLNAVGFALPILLAWLIYHSSVETQQS